MAGRIRTLKPEILEDEKTGALSHEAWRMFVSMILLADDYGNLRGNPRYLEGQVFWARECVEGASRIIRELLESGLVEAYELNGQEYLHLPGWAKHQRVDKPGKPRVPKPTEPGVTRRNVGDTTVSRESRESVASQARAGGERPENPSASRAYAGPPTSDHGPTTDEEDLARTRDRRPPPPGLDSDTESVCPLNLVERFTGFPEMAERLGVSEACLRAAAGEFVSYWTIGAGAGKHRSHWARKLRQDLVRKHEDGRLAKFEPATARPPEKRSAVYEVPSDACPCPPDVEARLRASGMAVPGGGS